MLEILHKPCLQLLSTRDLSSGKCSICKKIIHSDDVMSVERQTNDATTYTDKFNEILHNISILARGQKTTDYKETWKDGGLKGIFIKILIKYGRLRNLIWNKGCLSKTAVKDESIRDTLMDLAAYAVYGIICYDENNIDGIKAESETLLEMKKAINERLGI